MAYKKIEFGFSFADIAIQSHSDKNRNLLFLRQVESVINWQSIQDLLMKYFQTGKPYSQPANFFEGRLDKELKI